LGNSWLALEANNIFFDISCVVELAKFDVLTAVMLAALYFDLKCPEVKQFEEK
jgi:hypothetical protein